jgi:hypothetical protein
MKSWRLLRCQQECSSQYNPLGVSRATFHVMYSFDGTARVRPRMPRRHDMVGPRKGYLSAVVVGVDAVIQIFARGLKKLLAPLRVHRAMTVSKSSSRT